MISLHTSTPFDHLCLDYGKSKLKTINLIKIKNKILNENWVSDVNLKKVYRFPFQTSFIIIIYVQPHKPH
jgi:hypothetical protein